MSHPVVDVQWIPHRTSGSRNCCIAASIDVLNVRNTLIAGHTASGGGEPQLSASLRCEAGTAAPPGAASTPVCNVRPWQTQSPRNWPPVEQQPATVEQQRPQLGGGLLRPIARGTLAEQLWRFLPADARFYGLVADKALLQRAAREKTAVT